MRRGRKEKKGTNNKFLVWLICYLHDSQGYFFVVLALFFFFFPFSPSRFVVLVHIHLPTLIAIITQTRQNRASRKGQKQQPKKQTETC